MLISCVNLWEVNWIHWTSYFLKFVIRSIVKFKKEVNYGTVLPVLGKFRRRKYHSWYTMKSHLSRSPLNPLFLRENDKGRRRVTQWSPHLDSCSYNVCSRTDRYSKVTGPSTFIPIFWRVEVDVALRKTSGTRRQNISRVVRRRGRRVTVTNKRVTDVWSRLNPSGQDLIRLVIWGDDSQPTWFRGCFRPEKGSNRKEVMIESKKLVVCLKGIWISVRKSSQRIRSTEWKGQIRRHTING